MPLICVLIVLDLPYSMRLLITVQFDVSCGDGSVSSFHTPHDISLLAVIEPEPMAFTLQTSSDRDRRIQSLSLFSLSLSKHPHALHVATCSRGSQPRFAMTTLDTSLP